ncbi:MAG: MBL fold metallo-hydrolase [Candidatus Aenigmarchaeota archaeon]|nr:MBL fold metallo-hydrolase [Candidatus Aenigmarchaeota archaeon]
MIIRKFLHSCILVEDKGKRLLIDPGLFSFIEDKIKPVDIGAVDMILLTHQHADHYYPAAIKMFCEMKQAKIIADEEIGLLLSQEGLKHETIKANETKNIEGFEIKALEAPHGQIPTEIPHNLAFLINGTFLHPGDSFSVGGIEQCDIVALPTFAPWARLVDALHFAQNLKPKKVIPIHDAFVKDFMLERMYGLSKILLEKNGIALHQLALGEMLVI